MIFSVIVPFYNEQLYIERCIRALLDQKFNKNNYELIFIDNASSDRSAEIVRKFQRIKLLSENKKNPYTARNTGLRVATGEIIAFTDADCVVSQDWLNIIYKKVAKDSATIVLGKVLFPCDQDSPLRIIQDYQNAKIDYLLKSNKRRYLYGYTNNMAFSSDIVEKVGAFLEWPVPGDTEIIHRCLDRLPNARVHLLHEMVVLHLEVNNIACWLKKSFTYGKHNVLVSFFSDYRPLNITITRSITKLCSRSNNYPPVKKLQLFLLQILFITVYVSGMLIGYVKFKVLEKYSP